MNLRRVLPLLIGGVTLPVGPCDVLCDGGTCINSRGERVNAPPTVNEDISVRSEPPERGAGGQRPSRGAATVDWQTIFDIRVSDPDNDPLLIEWDLNGDGEFEQGGQGEAFGPSREEFPGDHVTTFYRRAGGVNVTARVSDFPQWLGAPEEVTRTRLVHVLDQAMRDANRPPQGAAFTLSPKSPRVGQVVRLEAAPGSDPDVWDSALRYRWEGFPEARTWEGFGLRTVDTQFYRPGTYNVRLKLLDALSEESVAEQQVTVREANAENTPPVASFVARPPSPRVDEEVTFDASASNDAEGQIIRYEWDLDGNGSFEVTKSDPTVTTTYFTPGERVILLRVTDQDGATDVARRPINVRYTPPSLTLSAPVFPAAAAARLRFSARVDGSPRPRGRAVGSLRAGFVEPIGGRETRVARRLRRFFNARWQLRIKRKFDARRNRLTASGVALARARGDRRSAACIRLRIDGVPGKPPSGRLTLLGGTGQAARLRGSARFVFRFESGGAATVLGPIGVREGKARPMPRACR